MARPFFVILRNDRTEHFQVLINLIKSVRKMSPSWNTLSVSPGRNLMQSVASAWKRKAGPNDDFD